MPTENGKKRGPKPKYGKPMTAAERKRLSRQKLSKEGGIEHMIKIEATEMEAIEILAQSFRLPKNDLIRLVFKNTMKRVASITAKGAIMRKYGKSENEISAFINKHLYPDLPTVKEVIEEDQY